MKSYNKDQVCEQPYDNHTITPFSPESELCNDYFYEHCALNVCHIEKKPTKEKRSSKIDRKECQKSKKSKMYYYTKKSPMKPSVKM